MKLLIIGVLFLSPPFVFADELKEAGVIQSVNGRSSTVQVIRNASQTLSAVAKDKVYYGDKILTEQNQSVILTTEGNNKVTIGSSSSFELSEETLKGSKTPILSLFRGMMRAIYKKSYSGKEVLVVKTPTAVMGVRGTDFVVNVDEKTHETQLHTISGRVAFAKTITDLVQSTANASLTSMVSSGQMSSLRAGMVKPEIKPFNVNSFQQTIQQQLPQIQPKIVPQPNQSIRNMMNPTPANPGGSGLNRRTEILNQNSGPNSGSAQTAAPATDSSGSAPMQRIDTVRGKMRDMGATMPGAPGIQPPRRFDQKPPRPGMTRPQPPPPPPPSSETLIPPSGS